MKSLHLSRLLVLGLLGAWMLLPCQTAHAQLEIVPPTAPPPQEVVDHAESRPIESRHLESAQTGRVSHPDARSLEAPRPVFFHAHRDDRVSEVIRRWLVSDGWDVVWEPAIDWVVPASFSVEASDPLTAVGQLSQWIQQQGAAIRLVAYEGNRVLVVRSLQTL